MLAQNDKYISEASETIYQLTQEERIRLQCEAREDYYRRQRSWDDRLAQAAKIEAENKELKATIEKLNTTIEKQNTTIEKLTSSFAALKAAMEANGITIDS